MCACLTPRPIAAVLLKSSAGPSSFKMEPRACRTVIDPQVLASWSSWVSKETEILDRNSGSGGTIVVPLNVADTSAAIVGGGGREWKWDY
ncbi:hypothetical protein FNV43_RR11677 [Rhamnella rubrinervis]|uniref:Uncharacterized protein n=1 Tax=Rhamnella rubrinervis TaxID=2594499 RepID=A0A8K0MI31_9ROSA|nr:hypothetical protein FNV43_RR11677 [Rhamnella rubrinervis]